MYLTSDLNVSGYNNQYLDKFDLFNQVRFKFRYLNFHRQKINLAKLINSSLQYNSETAFAIYK
jgi:hypothetical protein